MARLQGYLISQMEFEQTGIAFLGSSQSTAHVNDGIRHVATSPRQKTVLRKCLGAFNLRRIPKLLYLRRHAATLTRVTRK